MGSDARRAAERLIQEKARDLEKTIDEAEAAKLLELRFEMGQELGVQTALKKVNATETAWRKAQAEANDLLAELKDKVDERGKQVRDQAGRLRDGIRSRVQKLREGIWLGTLTDELKAQVMSLPTPDELRKDGLRVLLTKGKKVEELPHRV